MFQLACNDAAHKHGTTAFFYGGYNQKYSAILAAEKLQLNHFTITNAQGIVHQYDLPAGWHAKQFRDDWR